jgi:hypothetical protein
VVGTLYDISGYWPIPVAVRSKAYDCDRSIAGIAVSNPSKGTDVCLLCLVCVVQEAAFATS